MSLSQSLYQKQELKISPQLLQGLNVLQLNQLELTDYLKKKIEDNIFLEEEISNQNNLQSNNKEIFEENLYYKPFKNSSLSTSDIIERVTKQQEKLIENLLQQARIQYQEQDIEYKICQYLISSIDSHGFLSREDLLEVSKDLKCEQSLVEKVRKEIHNFNPLGMCCFDIREFLILQVEVKKKNPILISMLQDDYHNVMKKEHSVLTKKYNFSKEQLREILTSLSFLDIYPNSFQQQEIQYINPDVTLTKEKEEFFISINEEFFPKIKVDHEMHKNFSQQKKKCRMKIITICRKIIKKQKV